MTDATGEPKLERSVTLWQITLYGLGSMLGAGIYGLIGQAAGQLGSAVWMAFIVSMIAAMLTGLSYANIVSRYPKAGGAAYVTQRAYMIPLLSYVVGLTVVCSGLTSIATQSNVVAESIAKLLGLQIPIWMLAIGFLIFIGGILLRGIRECMWFNALCTVIEASGLLIVIASGVSYWGSQNLLEFPPEASHNGELGTIAILIMQGAVLTFFSFIGFEDMLNVAEEVKNPKRNMPLAIIIAMVAATVIYMAVAITAVSVMHYSELPKALALVAVVEKAWPWFPPIILSVITIFAVSNTALVNWVMGSRLLYGMSRQGLMPEALGKVNASRKTPHVAIVTIFGIVVVLSLIGDIKALAASTVLLLLTVFTVVNVALVILKQREPAPEGTFEVPVFIPMLGALVCSALIVVRLFQGGDFTAPAIAIGLILLITALYFVTGAGRDQARLQRFIEQEDAAAEA
ncbi:APC family permease [Chenggangzhangella methanolivorans]|uniref:Amino acid permease n=1 Tax=Chenggangzhangella methanolivorans TaxID=1437009 RepID=A0A9E6RCW7_9HYPH|nr:amino acid permease [Chenggangzhangella methanolivorans]QZO00928.1 amino acid permease [Chenggangzhangella methanolivorans]